jgi:hypothetical protein
MTQTTKMIDIGKKTGTTKPIAKPQRPKKKDTKTVQMNFRVSEKTRQAVEAAAVRRRMGLSEVLSGAIERCIRDDIWSPRARSIVARNKTIKPNPLVVDISNQMLELAMVLELLMQPAPDPTRLEQASRIYLDARVRLQALRDELRC